MTLQQMRIARTDAEIEKIMDRCFDAEMRGTSAYFSMTYEQGIKAALDWITDKNASSLFDEEA